MLISCLAGATAGGFFATSVGGEHSFLVAGWRFVFLVTASASILSGILVLLLASDPRQVRAACMSSPLLAALCRSMQTHLRVGLELRPSENLQARSSLLAVEALKH